MYFKMAAQPVAITPVLSSTPGRVYADSAAHGLHHRQRLRMFFYGFDVAVCNAFILYTEALPPTHKDRKVTMCEFQTGSTQGVAATAYAFDSIHPHRPAPVLRMRHLRGTTR
jgi:hypothetical protein